MIEEYLMFQSNKKFTIIFCSPNLLLLKKNNYHKNLSNSFQHDTW